jgi:hypothetical protein
MPSRKSRQAEGIPTLRRHPIGPQTALFALALEHFPGKWTPVFREKMRQNKKLERFPILSEDALARENDETITQMKKAEGGAAARTFRHHVEAGALRAASRFVVASVRRTTIISATAGRGRRRCPDLHAQSSGCGGRRRGADPRCRGLRSGAAIIGAAAIISLRRGGLTAAIELGVGRHDNLTTVIRATCLREGRGRQKRRTENKSGCGKGDPRTNFVLRLLDLIAHGFGSLQCGGCLPVEGAPLSARCRAMPQSFQLRETKDGRAPKYMPRSVNSGGITVKLK